MEKKVILSLILFVLLISFSCANIQNYVVPSEVNLGLGVTATGKSLNDSNVPNVNQLCSFLFLDANTGVLIDRATDQYTDQTGRFTMPNFYITEPTFYRGSNYTLKSICGSNETDSNFLVLQRESIAFYGQQEFDYGSDPNNIFTIAIWFFILLVAGSFIGFIIWYKKQWGK